MKIRAHAEKGGFEWHQEEPNTLLVYGHGKPAQIYRAGQDYLCESARLACRTPPGHPEGYLEAFANIYGEFMDHIRAFESGKFPSKGFDYPSILDGIDGMAFIEAVVRSSEDGGVWVKPDSLIRKLR